MSSRWEEAFEELSPQARELAWALRRRGLLWAAGNSTQDLPFDRAGLNATELQEFFRQLHSYSFRLFFRDIIRRRQGFDPRELVRYVNEKTALRYCQKLASWRLIHRIEENCWRLCSTRTRSFGETLEWYVAQLLVRSFGCSVAWGVRATLGNHGGDYDVIAQVEGRLLYIEVKSSPPKHISPQTIQNFLGRIEDLGPHLSIFLEDTHLRLEDKIIPMFADALGQRYGSFFESEKWLQCERRHLYSVNPPRGPGRPTRPYLFIANSRPSIEAGLVYCLRRMLTMDSLPQAPTSPTLPPAVGRVPEDATMLPEPPPSQWGTWKRDRVPSDLSWE